MDKLSLRISEIKPSITLEITSKVKKLMQQGKDVINFAAGEPDFDTPLFIKKAAVDAIEEGFTKYTPSTGISELKEAVSRHLKDIKGLEYSRDQIVIGCGAKHCLYNIFQVICSAEDRVVIPAPYWVSYPEMVKLAQGIPEIVYTTIDNKFKITKSQLSDVLNNKKVKAFILNSPVNPTGSVYSEKELKSLISVIKSEDIYIISDEIYDKLIYDVPMTSIASLDPQIRDRVIVVGGVSKTYAMTGWRIGYLAGPKSIVKAVGGVQSHSTSNPCSISQKAALSALTGNQKIIKEMISKFKKRREIMYSKLNSISKVKPFYPQGGFYIFCDISEVTKNSLLFAKELLEDKYVAVIPGIAFGYEGFVRISFATSLKQIEEGIDKIRDWIM